MMNDTKPLGKQDVQELLGKYPGNRLFQKALEESDFENIGPTLVKYVYFNRLFGAGVANLASKFAQQTDLFRDKEEIIASL